MIVRIFLRDLLHRLRIGRRALLVIHFAVLAIKSAESFDVIAFARSVRATCLNCLSAPSYQNECSSATPRSNGFCTLAEQEVGNETVPSFSVEVKCWCSSSALSGMSDTRRTKQTARVTSFIGFAT